MARLFYKPSALKVVKKFSASELSEYKKTLNDLQRFPEAGRFLKGTLRNLRKWKFKVGKVPYRIVYSLEKDQIVIIAVGKRKDFYELIK